MPQKPLVRAYNSSNFEDVLLSGDVWLAQGWNGQFAKVMEQDPEHRLRRPEGGRDGSSSTTSRSRGRAPPGARARLHRLHARSRDRGGDLPRRCSYSSPNRAAWPKLPAAIRRNTAVFPPPDVLGRLELDEGSRRDHGRSTTALDRGEEQQVDGKRSEGRTGPRAPRGSVAPSRRIVWRCYGRWVRQSWSDGSHRRTLTPPNPRTLDLRDPRAEVAGPDGGSDGAVRRCGSDVVGPTAQVRRCDWTGTFGPSAECAYEFAAVRRDRPFGPVFSPSLGPSLSILHDYPGRPPTESSHVQRRHPEYQCPPAFLGVGNPGTLPARSRPLVRRIGRRSTTRCATRWSSPARSSG